MFAAQNQEPSIIDALGSNITDWYNAIDEGLRKSDIVPGTYEYTTHPSYGNVGQLQEGADTNLDIQLNRWCIASLENSFITLEQQIPITINTSTISLEDNKLPSVYYIGYQYAAEAIYAYDIYSNSDRIQNITHANYEWFLLRNSVQPESKINSETYATLEKIRRRDPNVPGVYVDLSKLDGDHTITVNLKVKIPLNSFLLLRQLRYMLESFGKITINITPSYKNLVVAPAFDPLEYNGLTADEKKAFDAYYKNHAHDLDFGFHNLNQHCNFIIYFNDVTDKDGKVTGIAAVHDDVTFKCIEQTTDKVEIHTAYYMLHMDIANALAARYMNVPLIFPVQKIESKDFTTNLATGDSEINTALTIQLKHADGMAVVFKRNVNSHSCFDNPQIEYQFTIDGKTYPRRPYHTVDDLRNLNQTLDFLNFNNLATTSIDKDLANSLQPYYLLYTYDADGSAGGMSAMYHSADRSNFLLGIPFADGADFQGGLSTNGTIQIQLRGKRLEGREHEDEVYGQPVALFTEDAILKIRTVKPPGTPQISITSASLDQVLAAAGNV